MLANPTSSPRVASFWAPAALVTFLALLCYWPALHGALLWDDPAHVTRPDLRTLAGLGRIWTDVRATQQYYPVLHSAFWLESRLWGDAVAGYHLLNVLLHAANCCLFALVLRRVWSISAGTKREGLPAGVEWIAAAVLAVHPICVESVAWICEQKNTLSLLFYLGATLTYLRFVATRRSAMYAVATGMFLLALGTKTVTATLPAAMLVVLWWRTGSLAWRRDVVPLLPWFALAAIAGATTAWLEKHVIGADGVAFTLSFVDRLSLAGRVVWFYLGKTLWPGNLMFFYPRWDIAATRPIGLALAFSAVALTVVLWLGRRRTRGLLAGWLLFTGALFPALGFFNVYPFQFSYVADHFQYLAMLPAIAVLVGGASLLLSRVPRAVAMTVVACATVGMVGLSRQQSALYRDNETLFRATIARNPGSFMAHDVLASALAKMPGRSPETITEYRETIRLNPDYPDAHVGLAVELAKSPEGKAEAIAHYRQAIAIQPRYAEAHHNLAVELAADPNRVAEALEHYQEALRLKPRSAEAHANLAALLSRTPAGAADAMSHYEEALRLNPDLAAAHAGLANELLKTRGHAAEAITHYEAALAADPTLGWAHRNLAMVLAQSGRTAEAVVHAEAALQLNPADVETHNALAILFAQQGSFAKAREQWETALRINPAYESARRNLQRLDEMAAIGR